jgi:hypothetical protein
MKETEKKFQIKVKHADRGGEGGMKGKRKIEK